MATSSLLLRVLFASDRNSSYFHELLRPFHTTCHAGRAAALRTASSFRLDFLRSRGVSCRSLLSALLWAEHVTHLTISAEHITELLDALITQQQQQPHMREEGKQQAASGAQRPIPSSSGQLSVPTIAPITTSSSRRGGSSARGAGSISSSTTTSAATGAGGSGSSPAALLTTSTNSSTSTGIHPQPISTQPATVKPPGPRLKCLTVVGRVHRAASQQLYQLLDVLPGSHHLRRLEFEAAYCWYTTGMDVSWLVDDELFHGHFPSRARPPAVFYAAAEATDNSATSVNTTSSASVSSSSSGGMAVPHSATTTANTSSSNSSSSHMAAPYSASAGSPEGPSWRTSCHTVVAAGGQYSNHLRDLQPLLEPLQQLRGLYLQGLWVLGMEPHVDKLRKLRALHVHGVESLDRSGLLLAVGDCTNLRHLGITGCNPSLSHHFLVPFDALTHLTSAHVCRMGLNAEGLQALCGATSLQEFDISDNQHITALPDAFTRLGSLRRLIMSPSLVKRMPYGIRALGNLRELSWGNRNIPHENDNADKRLCLDNIHHLQGLVSLTLRDDYHNNLPGTMSCLTELKRLHVELWSGGSLPAALSSLVGLEWLVICGNHLGPLPQGLDALTNLTWLQVYGYKSEAALESVPATLQAILHTEQP